jgi:hypothetical protein
MAAKPQQMSDSQEKSDDLIAELAKLMANNAGGPEAGPKPSVIKLPPLNEATIKAAPVRIPGMDAPRPASDPPAAARPAPATMGAAPTVRIPGMEKPAGIDAIPAPQPRPTTQFDFGKPPAPTAIPVPEPMSNWQTSMPPKLPPAPPPRSPAVAQLAGMKFDPVKPISAEPPKSATPTVTRLEPKVSAPSAPIPVAVSATAVTSKSGSSDSFGFGFTSDSQPRPNPTPANDPIADLIAADLDAELDGDGDDQDEAPAAAPVQAAPAQAPVPVATKPMPATVANEVLPNPIAPRPITQIAPRAVSAPPAAIQLKPVSIAPRSEGDRFTVAPVFSNPRPAPTVSTPPQQAAQQSPRSRGGDLDPMDEIENLIGEAVRVELSAPEKSAAPAVSFSSHSAAPVVPPLSSGFAPRRANMRDKEPQVESAEAAILAAAAASGAEVGRVDSPAGDDRPYKRMKVKPPRTSGVPSGARQYVGIAVAGTLLLAAGFGLYWVIGMGREDPTTAPVLTADAGAVKVQPAPATTASTQSGSVVFDEINGTAAVDNSETLVSRDETAGTTPTEVARAVVVEPTDSTETGLANRKVRTVTVRPDGTIVSGDEGVAGAEELPVDRPNVPEIAGGELAPSELLTAVTETQNAAGVPAATAPDPITALVDGTAAATASPLPDPAPLTVATVEPTAGNDAPATFDASIVAPIPMPRPVSRGTGFSGGNSQPVESASVSNSAIAPAPTPLVVLNQQPQEAAPASSGGGNGAYVQLSSQPSEADASRQLRATQQRMSGMLNGAQLEIRRVDLGSKGVWYRVVLPVNSFRDATQTCASIKSNGLDCVAING